MTQVFISYSRKDLEFVDRLANDLKATGFEVWYDLSGLEPGTRWRQEIQAAIQDSQFFLVVLSPNSIVSDWVEREFLFASEQEIKIIPVLYQPCILPMWSLNLHFIDMQGKNYALHYQNLLKVMGMETRSTENPIAIRYIEIGDEYRKRGQASQAIESYLQALNIDPGNLKARTNIGALHLMEQEYSQAVEAYHQALQISSEDPVARAGWCDANMALGNQARADGSIENAIRYYLEILRIDADEPVARQSLVNIYTSRAESHLAAGEEDQSLVAFSEAIKYSPDDPILASRLEKIQAGKKDRVLNDLMGRAEAEISSGNWDQALELLTEALQTSPQDAFLLQRITHIQSKQLNEKLKTILARVDKAEKTQRWDAALTGLQEYLHLKPDDKAIQKRMADLLQSKHAAWLGAITLRVNHALEKHDWDEALAALQEALQLEPDNKELMTKADRVKKDQHSARLKAMILRADQAASAGRWDDAIGILNTGLTTDPGNATLKTKLADTLQARQKLQRQSVLNLADAAASAGKWENALALLNQVLAEEPDNPVFLERYNRILALERDSKLNLLHTRARSLLKEHKFEDALAAWNETLLLAPENRQAVMAEIEAVNKAQKLEANYSEGLQALAAKDYQQAADLLNSVLLVQPGYKDATVLLAKARKLLRSSQKKPVPGGRRVGIIGVVLTILTVGIGAAVFWLVKVNLPTTPARVTQNIPTTTNGSIQVTNTPDPRKINPANQHQYQLLDNSYSWQDARDDCAVRGGYLATIQDSAEDQFIYQLIPSDSIWLGATDENEEGIWTWVTGEPWMYTNWADNQPDNYRKDDPGGENYLAYLWPVAPSQWNDTSNVSMPYVCEWEPSLGGKTITVTSAEDNGPGTLRQAMLDARSGDIITFDPATFPANEPKPINLYSQLPVIDQGYLTLDASNAGVVLNGSHVGGEWTPGLDIWSDYNVIKGLGILSFSGPGISIQGNSNFNTIGGDRAIGLGQIGEGNFVGANSDGIAVSGSDNIIKGNLVGIIGVDAEDWNVGNRAAGIFLAENASRNTIGPDNIIAYNGTVGGCGIEYISLDARDNNLTANIIYTVKLMSPGICYNVNPGGQFVYSTPPVILYVDLETGIAAGQTCPNCLVEIFSTNTQDAKYYEGAVMADGYGNFVLRKSGAFTGPYLTATTRDPGENTSEFSLPTPKLSDIQIALNEAWMTKPVFETSFNSWDFGELGPNARLEEGKLIVTSLNQEHVSVDLSRLNSSRFAAEFEFQVSSAGYEGGHCIYEINKLVEGESYRSVSLIISPNGQVELGHLVSQDNYPTIASSTYIEKTINKVKLVVLEDKIAVFVNDEIAFVTLDPDGSVAYPYQGLAASHTIVCEYDNYKLWDLSGVELNP